MDILKPELMWINKRCYRLNPCHTNVPIISEKTKETNRVYVEEDLYSDEDGEEGIEAVFKNGQFESSFHIPSMFFSHIIGTKGLTKKRIESETTTRIIVPTKGSQGDVIVIGKSRKNVTSACRKLNLIVLASRSKIASTHFVSVPFNSSTIKDSFIRFKNEIIKNSELINFHENFFIRPEKLHLTINVLTLVDNEDRMLASEILNECKATLIRSAIEENDGEIYLHLKGLEIMNDDPSTVDVLYGVVKCDALQYIADGIMDIFCKNNLCQKKTDKVKLHVTLINSKFGQNEETNNQQRLSFDARRILENYINYDFGIQKLKEIHLSQRFSTGSDGFYSATTVLKL